MAEKLKVQVQDEKGNIYYQHTSADVVFCEDGESVETKLSQKFDAANIVQNATTAATDKVPSAAVAKNLQDQITQQNTKLGKNFRYIPWTSINQSTPDHPYPFEFVKIFGVNGWQPEMIQFTPEKATGQFWIVIQIPNINYDDGTWEHSGLVQLWLSCSGGAIYSRSYNDNVWSDFKKAT